MGLNKVSLKPFDGPVFIHQVDGLEIHLDR
jgi:hypothetical protein